MSKTVELARHLEKLHINNMYKTDFYWTWDKTDDEIDAVFTVADALRDLRERNKSTKVFNSGLGISLFRDNSTRTRFSFASACNLLGLEEQVLDEKKSQIAHGETVRETANMVSFMADVIGIRDDMYIHQGHEYQKTFMDALEEGYRDGILEDYVSKRGFLRIYAELAGSADPALTVADLGRMASEGDPAAKATFAEAGRILAGGIRGLLEEQKIECLLMGGQISRSFALLEPALREGLQGVGSLRTIAPAAHIGHAAFYGLLAQLDADR